MDGTNANTLFTVASTPDPYFESMQQGNINPYLPAQVLGIHVLPATFGAPGTTAVQNQYNTNRKADTILRKFKKQERKKANQKALSKVARLEKKAQNIAHNLAKAKATMEKEYQQDIEAGQRRKVRSSDDIVGLAKGTFAEQQAICRRRTLVHADLFPQSPERALDAWHYDLRVSNFLLRSVFQQPQSRVGKVLAI